ncbi:DNA translocase FtsK [Prolixibacteraceae bacterium JC049]|nr:DNA translocase FtsK [Prolixibacteraceae bacterium JC049]
MTQKKKSTKKKSKVSKLSLFTKYFTRKKLRLITGIVFFLFAFYLTLSILSAILHAGADQSIIDSNVGDIVGRPAIKAKNWMGKGGAWLADLFMNRGFGFAAIGFAYIATLLGLFLVKVEVKRLGRKIFIAIFFILWTSIALGFCCSSMYSTQHFLPGGSYGYFMADWLYAFLGGIGTTLALLVSIFIFGILAFENSIEILQQFIPKKKEKEQVEDEEIDNEEEQAEEKAVNEDIASEEDVVRSVTEDDRLEAVFEEENNDSAPTVDFASELTDLPSETEEVEQPIEEEAEVEEKVFMTEDLDIPAPKAPPVPNDDLEVTVAQPSENEPVKQMDMLEDYDPTLDLSNYKVPSVELLIEYGADTPEVSNDELISNKNKIVETLRNYKIEITKIKATIGPTVTLYEIVPAPGVRIAKIKNLEDDIALSLAALGIRIIAPIPGKGTIGIEVPNRKPEVVSMRSIIASKKFQESNFELPVALGKTITNETFVVDLAKMPHVLVAGATGQGKSVGLNAIITSLLYKKHPSQLKFVFVDPKKVELNLYSSIENHFLAKMPDEEEPIITDIHKVKATLNSLNIEMDARYDLLKKAHARNIKEYNKKFISRKLNPENGHHFLPYIVLVVDEFADLIMTAGKDIETPIARIAQLARAVGIHMIIATQRPSTNIITGVIKANFPSRIAFKVASMIDSRTILDQPGANQLIGKGDMLISVGSDVTRVQCAFVDTPEVEAICDCISEQRGYPTAFMLPEYEGEEGGTEGISVDMKNRDEYFEDAARLVAMNQSGSTSLIQRKFSIGYNRAGRIMDQLEAAGIVGPSEGSKARQVLVQDEYALEQLLNSL